MSKLDPLCLLLVCTFAGAAPTKPGAAPPGPVPAAVADSLLRVACDDEAGSAEVTLNGKFKGECPLDIAVAEGSYKLRVLKSVDALHERDFEQDIRMGSGVVKKVEVALSPVHLNAEGKRQDEIRRAEAARAEDERREAAARAETERRRLAEEALQRERAAIEAIRTRAEAGEVGAMKDLARRYAGGNGVPEDGGVATTWFAKAAAAGDLDAMFTIGTRYENGIGVSQDYAQAVTWYRRCAEKEHGPCVGALAAMHLNGWGVQRDYAQAAQWARKGEALQSGRAVFALANLSEFGWGGLPQDHAAYRAYVRRAAELGEPRAMYWQSRLELTTTSPYKEEELNRVRYWLEKAVKSGPEGGYAYAASLSNIAIYYLEDFQVASPFGKRDDKAAVPYLVRAAEAGDDAAMHNLAVFYRLGRGGLPVNQALAQEWDGKAQMVRQRAAAAAAK